MKFVISVDPATTTGIALVAYGVGGPPMVLASDIVKLKVKDRWKWCERATDAVVSMVDGKTEPWCSIVDAQWVIETWSHHRNFRDAIRLAQIQQMWIGVATDISALDPVLYNVTSWQAAIGAGRLKSKVHGINARKDHAQMWAKRTYGFEGKISNDVADALCMASVWIGENRHTQSELTL